MPPSLAGDVLLALQLLAGSRPGNLHYPSSSPSVSPLPVSVVIALSSATVPAFPPGLSPRSVLGLSVRTFPFPPLDAVADAVMERLLCHPHGSLPFVMGPGPLSCLLDSYCLHSRSLSSLLRSVLVSSNLHFSKAGSYMCLLHRQEYSAEGGYGQVCARTLDWVRHVPEFQEAIGGKGGGRGTCPRSR